MEPSFPASLAAIAAVIAAATGLTACYNVLPSSGGGQAQFAPPRIVRAADVAVPKGYRLEAVSTGLTFPTGVAFDASGVPHVVEAGYSYGEVWTTPRLLRIDADGSSHEVARGGRNGPWTGVAFANGAFFIAEGGQLEGGRILRVDGGSVKVLVSGLPSFGDHHTNGPAVGSDGKIYFGQGTATNSGVVGKDNLDFGWLKRHPRFHDIPCQSIELTGENFDTDDVLDADGGRQTRTGAFVPFGQATAAGQTISGELPCNGAIMRVGEDGGELELVSWGLRNPFGLAFAPDGRLYVTDNGFDDRGSRPVWGAGDVLWRIEQGAWYGWPDLAEGRSIAHDDYRPPGRKPARELLARRPAQAPRPVAVLGVHASSNGLDFSRSATFGYQGQAFIAEFGDQAPTTGKSLHPAGFRIVRVDVSNGVIETFAVNKGRMNGPASKLGTAGFERPVAVRFSPSGDALYVVDFGVLLQGKDGSKPQEKTGVLWRITRTGQ